MIPFKDYIEEGKRGLWDNIHAKRERIKNGSGEKMRKPGSKGAPTAAALKASQVNEEDTKVMHVHHDGEKIGETGVDSEASPGNGKWFAKHYKSKMNSVGFDSRKEAEAEVRAAHGIKESTAWAKQAAIAIAMRKAGKKPQNEDVDLEEETPYYNKPSFLKKMSRVAKQEQQAREKKEAEAKKPVKEELSVDAQFDLIEDMVMSIAEQHNLDPEMVWEKFEEVSDDELFEAAVDAKGYKSSTGGLTQKGRDHYNNTEGGNLKAPVTTPPSKLKAGSKAANRRKSFCARMSGVDGPMKKPNGEPTRKALALRKWNC